MNRKSVSFAPMSKTNPKSKGRKTESFLDDDEEDHRDPNTVIYETLMSDPLKRAMILQLLTSEKDSIEKYKRKEEEQMRTAAKSPLHKLKRNLILESPTALLRRRALQQKTTEFISSSSESSTPSPSPIEFDKLLEGVKVFVDVRSKNEDRSAAVKALVRSMGAHVKEEFTSSVTHVIFKDGSFQTYHKAKLLKKHLVSVLWVESVRTSRCRVPEHNYPALGMPSFEKNVSLICEKMQDDYQEILTDEMSRSFNKSTSLSQRQHSSKKHRQTTLPSEFYFTAMSKPTTSCEPAPGTSEDIIPGSQDMEVTSIFSAGQKNSKSANLPKTPDSCFLPESDSDSHCGIIDGESFSKNKSSQSSTVLPSPPKSDSASIVGESPVLSPPKCDDHNKNQSVNGGRNVRRSLYSEVDFIKSNFLVPNNLVEQSPFVTKRRKTTMGLKDRTPKKIDNKENESKNYEIELENISEVNSINNSHNENVKPKFNDKFVTKRRTKVNPNIVRNLGLYLDETIRHNQSIPLQDEAPVTKKQTFRNPRESLESSESNAILSEDLSAGKTVAVLNSEEFKVPGNRRSSPPKIVPSSSSDTLLLEKNLHNNQLPQDEVSKAETSANPRESLESNATSHSEDLCAIRTRKSIVAVKSKEFKVLRNRRSSSRKTVPSLSSDTLPLDKNHDPIQHRDEDPSHERQTNPRESIESNATSTSEDLSAVRRTRKSVAILNSEEFKVPGNRRSSTQKIVPPRLSDTSTIGSRSEDVIGKRISTNSVEEMLPLRISDSSIELSLKIDSKANSTSFSSVSSINSSSLIKDIIADLEQDNNKGVVEPNNKISKESTPRRSVRNSTMKVNANNNLTLSNGTQKGFKTPKVRKALQQNKMDNTNISKGIRNTNEVLTSDESGIETAKKNRKPRTKRKSNDLLTSDESESESKRKKNQPKTKPNKKNNKKEVPSQDDQIIIPETPINNATNSSSDSSGQKRRRKLYDPNASMESVVKTKIIEDVNNETQNKKDKKQPIPTKSVIIHTENALKLLNNIMDQGIEEQATLNSTEESPELPVELEINVPKKNPKKTAAQKKVVVDPDLDEQKNLLNDVLDKRRSPRKQQKNLENDTLPIKPYLNRRSTMDFLPKQTPTPKKTLTRNYRVRRPSIVCTRFHRKDVLVFQEIVKKLGSFIVENDVVENTTHLVAAESSRTINILRAMAKGIWILRAEWLYRSLENGKWLPEEEFELTEFNPAVQQCRIQRQTFGSKYSMDIFQNCGAIYVTKNTNPKCTDLEELIRMCKGKVAKSARVADIVVGEFLQFDHVKCVTELWVMDSITFNRCKNITNYLIKPAPARTSDHF